MSLTQRKFESFGIVGDKSVVVIDIGSAYTKCGFAGEFSPRAIVPSVYEEGENDRKVYRIFDKNLDAVTRRYVMTAFLREIYYKHLLAVPRERRAVIVESVLNASGERHLLASILYETLDAPSILFAPSHLVSTFAFGTANALVVDVGYRETLVIPVFEGVAMLNNWEAAPLAMRALQSRVKELLLKYAKVEQTSDSGDIGLLTDFAHLLTPELLEDVCVRFCFCTTFERAKATAAVEDDAKIGLLQWPADVRLDLTEDTILVVPGFVRETAAEIFFTHGDDIKSIPQLILDSIFRCPIDLRRPLIERLLVVGGTSLMRGFSSRLKAEILYLLTDEYGEKLPKTVVKFYRYKRSPVEGYCQWLGGSLFGSLEVLPYRSMSREEWLGTRRLPDWTDIISQSTGID